LLFNRIYDPKKDVYVGNKLTKFTSTGGKLFDSETHSVQQQYLGLIPVGWQIITGVSRQTGK
jgi:hypothetical protein